MTIHYDRGEESGALMSEKLYFT